MLHNYIMKLTISDDGKFLYKQIGPVQRKTVIGTLTHHDDKYFVENAFISGAKWADENPNKKLVYTKKELLDMGFTFDLNGNISTPQEIEEKTKKYINYQKDKWIKTAYEWLEDYAELTGIDYETIKESFKKAIEEEIKLENITPNIEVEQNTNKSLIDSTKPFRILNVNEIEDTIITEVISTNDTNQNTIEVENEELEK